MLDRGLQFFDCGSVFNFTQVSGSLEITGFELKDGSPVARPALESKENAPYRTKQQQGTTIRNSSN